MHHDEQLMNLLISGKKYKNNAQNEAIGKERLIYSFTLLHCCLSISAPPEVDTIPTAFITTEDHTD